MRYYTYRKAYTQMVPTSTGVRALSVSSRGGHNPLMRIKRPARVNIKVTDEVKARAAEIASAMSTPSVAWTETDVFEQGVLCLSSRRDVRDALAAQASQAEEGGE